MDGRFAFDIAKSQIHGFSSVNKYGRTTNADSGDPTDIWDRANATQDQAIWLAPTAARVHAIVSGSADDDDGGNGANTIQIYGLTAWDADEVSEVITMDGTTPVNTSNSYVIIHRMKVLTWGSTGPNTGLITATAAVDGTVTAQINAGEGQTQMAIYGVPSTKRLHVLSYYTSFQRAQPTGVSADIRLLLTDPVNGNATKWITKHTQSLNTTGTSAINHAFEVPAIYNTPCIIKLQVNTDTDNSDLSGGFDLVLSPA